VTTAQSPKAGNADTLDVSVVIPARNAGATIAAQLGALANQEFAGTWEVIVADNGSTDDTVQVVEGYRDRLPLLKVVEASQRAGSSHARNQGAVAAVGRLLCFCDADDVVAPGWLASLASCSELYDIVGGRLEMDSLNSASARSWRPTPQAARPGASITFAPSGNMAITAALFRELGGFDVEYMKSHDVEFGHRARSLGYSIGFCAAAVVAYRLRSDLPGLAMQGFRGGRARAQSCADGQVAQRAWTSTLQDWWWLVIRIPTLVSQSRRGIWVRRAAEAVGRFVGSIRWRIRHF
jgi:glycosyltransferase involved in cell wall biosynthesis